MPGMIERQLPALLDYMDSRMQQTKLTKSIKKGNIIEDTQGLTTSSVWLETSKVRNTIFEKDAEIEGDVKLQFADVPKVHDFNEEVGELFFDALGSTD